MPSKIGLLIFTAAAAAAQQPPTFHVGTQLVQVSVVAEDKMGKPVADLRQEEFQLFDNGSPQEIRLFLNTSEASNSPRPVSKAPNTFTNQTGLPEGSHSGYSVIAFDTLSTELADPNQGGSGAIWVKGKALQTLETLPPGDEIAIYATGKKIEVIREFTRDRDSLKRQLQAWKPSIDTPSVGTALCAGMPEHAIGDCVRHDALRRVTATQDEVTQIVEHLAGIPGRKNLIWIAWQFPFGPPAVQKLKNADIAIYPVDAHGSVIGLKSEKSDATSPLRALAAQTGGVAFYDRDDLDVAIRQAVEDGRVSYTLGFYPPGDDKAPQIHRLAVRVSHPGVTLRYRTSYQTEAPPPVSANPRADLIQAMNRPIDTATIPVRVRATRAPGQESDRLSLQAAIDVQSLGLVQNQDLWTGKIEVVARFTTVNGALAGEGISQTLVVNLRQNSYDNAVRDGLPYRNELKIPAKAVELKLLVANLATGKIGTVTIPLSEIETTANAK